MQSRDKTPQVYRSLRSAAVQDSSRTPVSQLFSHLQPWLLKFRGLLASSGPASGSFVWPGPRDDTNRQVVNYLHSQLSGWKSRHTSLTLKRQSCVLSIPGFPSAYCKHRPLCSQSFLATLWLPPQQAYEYWLFSSCQHGMGSNQGKLDYFLQNPRALRENFNTLPKMSIF